jgi:hypothetical protein
MLLQDLQALVPRVECWSCECLQGLVVQLELDAGDALAYLTNPLIEGSVRCWTIILPSEQAEALLSQSKQAFALCQAGTARNRPSTGSG